MHAPAFWAQPAWAPPSAVSLSWRHPHRAPRCRTRARPCGSSTGAIAPGRTLARSACSTRARQSRSSTESSREACGPSRWVSSTCPGRPVGSGRRASGRADAGALVGNSTVRRRSDPARISGRLVADPYAARPADGSIFDHFPRTTILGWSIVPEADAYLVQRESCSEQPVSDYVACTAWTPLAEETTADTILTFGFVGAQAGRWRVASLDADGNAGPFSPWQHFVYLQ